MSREGEVLIKALIKIFGFEVLYFPTVSHLIHRDVSCMYIMLRCHRAGHKR